jgi:histidine triad (HIT) family protein
MSEALDPNCLFCKIIKREIETVIAYENEHTIAVLDTNPAGTLVGHTVVISKHHTKNIEETPIEQLCELMKTIKLLVPAIKKVSGANAVNILRNDGKEAGELVPHIHFHIIPRTHGDGIHMDSNRRNPKPMERTEAAKAIKEELEK